eukprot:7747354-Alexandrium_andersonii.AAC.1
MSASLVGSEMCIRDRPKDIPKYSTGPRGPVRTAHPPGRGVCGDGPEDSVSYTHLTLPTICSV